MKTTLTKNQRIGAATGAGVELPAKKDLAQQTDRPDLRAEIETRAYHLWRSDGGRHGNDLNHWLQAEREILNYARTNKP